MLSLNQNYLIIPSKMAKFSAVLKMKRISSSLSFYVDFLTKEYSKSCVSGFYEVYRLSLFTETEIVESNENWEE